MFRWPSEQKAGSGTRSGWAVIGAKEAAGFDRAFLGGFDDLLLEKLGWGYITYWHTKPPIPVSITHHESTAAPRLTRLEFA